MRKLATWKFHQRTSMNWVSWTAHIIYTAIFITHTYAEYVDHCMAETNTRTSEGFWPKEFPSVKTSWYERVSSNMVPAQQGVRKERYYTEGGINDRTLRFKSLQLDDGGRYAAFNWDTRTWFFHDLLVIDDIRCNGTETHTAVVGDNITYACSFKYQGMLWQDNSNVIWRDESGTKLKQEEHIILSKVPVPSARRDTCYTGEVMYTTTLTVTANDDGTRRMAEFTDRCYGILNYRQTGKVMIPSCENLQCKNGATCNPSYPECICDDKYTGKQCNETVLCANVVCENGGECYDFKVFFCQCQPRYKGTFCQTKITLPPEAHAEAKTSNTNLSYLALLLVWPLAAVCVAVYVTYRRRNRG